MSTQSFPNIEAILNQYQLEEVIEIKPITVGLIHQTLGLVTEYYDYICQKENGINLLKEVKY